MKKRRRLALLLLLVLLALASYGGESIAAQGGGNVEDRADINIIVVLLMTQAKTNCCIHGRHWNEITI